MTTVTYRIHLNEPAIFSALEGDPNAAVSYPYIPGSAIRGLIIGLFIKEQRHKDPSFVLDAAGDMQTLFFSPQTCYLNAYPLIEGERSLPVPATWTIPKYKTQQEIDGDHPIIVTDSALPQPDDGAPKGKLKNISGFTTLSEGTAAIYKPATTINVHTARARRSATEQQVFRYEALADGQTFMGAILCHTDDNANRLVELLADNPQVVLGGSRTAGYGSATISDVQIESEWPEVNHQITDQIVLTFLSDTLLNDDRGMFIPSPVTLQAHLTQMGIVCQVQPISIKTTWVGGFNRKWGLPLPQMIAIERGSVVRLTELKAHDDAIRWLIAYGIGDRREDGFGRVALGWQQQPQLTYARYTPSQNLEDVELSAESKFLLQTVRQRIRDRELEERIAGILYDKHYTIYGSISRTQLSRLRLVIANELRKDQPGRNVISGFLTQISGKAGGRQFDSARIGNQPLSEWLKNPTFEELGESITSKDHYVLQLVDTVLERAYRERDKQAQQEVS